MPTAPPRVLVVEDDFIIASALQDQLTDLGYACVGPVGDLKGAIALVEKESFDAAILDVILSDGRVDLIADMLADRSIPFAFASGDTSEPAAKWVGRPVIEKPYTDAEIERVLGLLLRAQ